MTQSNCIVPGISNTPHTHPVTEEIGNSRGKGGTLHKNFQWSGGILNPRRYSNTTNIKCWPCMFSSSILSLQGSHKQQRHSSCFTTKARTQLPHLHIWTIKYILKYTNN